VSCDPSADASLSQLQPQRDDACAAGIERVMAIMEAKAKEATGAKRQT
jgi:hypothetical protein